MIQTPEFQNNIKLNGALSIIVTDGVSGKTKQEIYIPNLVVTTGRTFIASRMVGTSAAIMSHMGIGTSATGEVVGDTALGSELSVGGGFTGYSRAALSIATSSANVVSYSANFAANNPSAPAGGAVLREAGIFNAASGGTMLCRTTFPIVTKLPADALTITWTITIQ
jgi:hypothetical protein